MKQLEKMIRDELLPGAGDIHLSIFVPEGTAKERCANLKEMIVEATKYLRDVFRAHELEAFIGPLAQIGLEKMESYEGGVGFFRTQDTFKAISIPVEINKECVVSNHFHIKPLLKWLQEDAEYFCVDFSRTNVEVFRGDTSSFNSLGCLGLGPHDVEGIEECIIKASDEDLESLVFLSGNLEMAKEFLQRTHLLDVDRSVIDRSAYHGDYERLWQTIKDRIRHRSVLKVKRSLLDFNIALMNGVGRSDLCEIIAAAKEGNIKKLIVSQEEKVWGRYDAYKNNVNRENRQINYEDDDLLDSVSEKVLESGGEVVMASNKLLPKGKTALAILKKAA